MMALPQVKYPQVSIPERPKLEFEDIEGLACLEFQEIQNLLDYVLTLESQLNQAFVTIKEINSVE